MNTSILFVFGALVWAQNLPLKSIDPRVKKVVDEISTERIAATMKKLESFGTRNPHSAGADAARAWIAEQFRSYSPRLDVRLDKHPVKKGGRFVRDLDIVNIVAVLPGKSEKERHVLVSGHYDSLAVVRKKDTSPGAKPDAMAPDWEASANAPLAPGVSDDASGTAVALELARVMSQYEWEKTLVFIAFDAEEEGLIGSNRYAEKAKKAGMIIDGVLNNDIVGNDVGGDGKKESARVRVFSDDQPAGASRSLARYIKEVGERYVPSMTVDVVFRADRFGRGGDHTSLNNAGFPAVRFTTEAEHYRNQHTAMDSFENSSPSYAANVARVNCAAAAALALAPAAPEVTREVTTGPMKGRRMPMLGRGESGYDADLKWTDPKDSGPVAGYVITMRATTAPYWQKEWYAGAVHEYKFADTSIDDVVFGVKAVDKDGNESPVSAYVLPRMIFEAPADATPEKK
jgi:Peptidase family M28